MTIPNDPDRAERESVNAHVLDLLRGRGVDIDDSETTGDVAMLLEAVERFESAVSAKGGDLMMDSYPARQPDDPAFVLPSRRDDETVQAYTSRVAEATAAISRRA